MSSHQEKFKVQKMGDLNSKESIFNRKSMKIYYDISNSIATLLFMIVQFRS